VAVDDLGEIAWAPPRRNGGPPERLRRRRTRV